MTAKWTWEQKLSALQALADTSLRMRSPGDWYVSAVGRYIVGDGFERGASGDGTSPETAVENDWEQMVTKIQQGLYIKTRDGRRVIWNGFMWAEVPR